MSFWGNCPFKCVANGVFSLIFQTPSIPALFFRPGFLFCPRGNVRSAMASVSLATTCCVLEAWRLTSESMLTAARATAGVRLCVRARQGAGYWQGSFPGVTAAVTPRTQVCIHGSAVTCPGSNRWRTAPPLSSTEAPLFGKPPAYHTSENQDSMKGKTRAWESLTPAICFQHPGS